ncbi:hypothetical protein [Aquibium microcysteis]|uniref:hypothetical protein n=1 Tax=Aquibium microcysteis TaxID=675281 RepID=UPI00165CFAC6|nr:hypothetical protein [Aquibium microcysteis]
MSDNRIAPEILELIRRTSTVGGCSNVFSLAPRGHRVGFYFQQRRATLLAKALRDRLGEDGLKSAKIAVIGAGVSGVTFFLSLIHFGAKNVFIYDASDGMLNTGASAEHRLVHPNYNRWPMLGSMDLFTALPLLNWCAGTARDVVEQLRTSVRNGYTEKTKDRFRRRHRCVSVTEQEPELINSVRVLFDVDGIQHGEDFQIVVISVGFGEEDCVRSGLEDYWTPERNPLDTGHHKREARVFGTGDGALIDILRCCAREPNDAWQIPLGLIGGLRDESAIVLQEDMASGPVDPRSLEFTAVEIEIQRHEESIRAASWHIVKKSDMVTAGRYIAQEEVFYRGLAGRLRKDEPWLCNFLEGRLKPAAEAALKPKLIGEITTPFEPTSAPINKLLAAYLLETDRILYECKPRTETDEELRAIKDATRLATVETIAICRYGANRNFPSTKKHRPANTVDVFLKVNSSATKSDETDLESQLIDLLSGLSGGEYVYFDAMPHPLELARNGHNQAQMIQGTRERFKPIIEGFARAELGATEVTLIPPRKQVPAKWSIKTEMRSDAIQQKLRLLGGIDGIFCGAPIVVTREILPEEENF